MRARAFGLIGLLGGAGGAINAWLCYAQIPSAAAEGVDFAWWIIPMGLLHGGLLASMIVGAAGLLVTHRWPMQWAGLPVIGWLSGWIPTIPLHIYIRSHGTSVSWGEVLKALWPFEWSLETLWAPLPTFGTVGLAYYFLLIICRQMGATRLIQHVGMGSVSGVVGSLWWWIAYKPWYFSLIHGTIWGALVGFGVWRAQHSSTQQT